MLLPLEEHFMKKQFLIIPAILMALVAGIATSALAQRPGKGFGHHGGWMLKRMTKQLNLTDAQQTQIKGIMASEKTRIKPLMQQMRQNEQAQNASTNGTFDENQTRAFAGKQAQIMTDLIVEKQRMRSEVFAVLTLEQRQKAQQLMQERQQRRQSHMKQNVEQTQQAPK
jgi:Spy/CpxP family protein refolding chaperone